MKLSILREALLKPLQSVIGVVERRQTLPILSNVLLKVEDERLSLTGTDLEVELVGRVTLDQVKAPGEITVPGRKLMDICRALPEGASVSLSLEKNRVIVRSGRSRFTLSTLPATDFPAIDELGDDNIDFSLTQKELRHLTERTHFAMAQQDVRYYLNGMLLEVKDGMIRTVATDGHRLALNTINAPVVDNSLIQAIIPRKGIIELMRLLDDPDEEVSVSLNSKHARVQGAHFTFTSKLVDGKFPDYNMVLPRDSNKEIVVDRLELKQALTRVSILSNEAFRGIRFQLSPGLLRLTANNPEQEEAEEEISIDYQGDEVEVGFNVSYLIDVLSTMDADRVCIRLKDGESSSLIEEAESDGNCLYVIMPMRI